MNYVFFDPAVTGLFEQERETASFAANEFGEGDALVGITGAAAGQVAEWRAIEDGLPLVTAATILLIAIVLGIHFRSPVTPAVILAGASVAYVVSLRTVTWMGDWIGVAIPRDAEPILVVLLLGVVTDYGIFFLHGMREQLDAGAERVDAAQEATAQYLPIVVTAGLIVAGGTAALMAGRLAFFRDFGPGMALTVLVSLVVAITLVPALMAILGQRAFWPRGRADEQPDDRPSRVAYFVTARPVALGIAVGRRGRARARGTRPSGDPARRDADRGPAERLAAAPRPGRGRQGLRAGILSPTVVLVEKRRGRGRARSSRAFSGGGAGGRCGDRAVLGDG